MHAPESRVGPIHTIGLNVLIYIYIYIYNISRFIYLSIYLHPSRENDKSK